MPLSQLVLQSSNMSLWNETAIIANETLRSMSDRPSIDVPREVLIAVGVYLLLVGKSLSLFLAFNEQIFGSAPLITWRTNEAAGSGTLKRSRYIAADGQFAGVHCVKRLA